MTQPQRTDDLLRDLTAVALGLSVPAMVSGRAVLQGLAAVALLASLWLAWRDPQIRAAFTSAIRSRFGYVVLFAFAAMGVSIPTSLDPMRSFEAWSRTLGYIGGCTLFWAILSNDRRSRILLRRTFLVAILIGTVSVATGQLGWEAPYRLLRGDFTPWASIWAFITAKGFAAALGVCVPLTLWFAYRERGSWRMAAIVACLLQISLVITTVNKSALAGFLAMTLAACLATACRGDRKTVVVWLVSATVAIIGMLVLVYELPDEPPAAAVWDWMPPQLVDTHRQQIWHFTVGKIAESPWLGYGMNCIDRVAGAKMVLPGYTAEALPSHPHNWMLEILSETGVIGFIPVLFGILWLAVRSFLRYVRHSDYSALVQMSLSAAFWGASLFNFSIWSTWWLITYFLFLVIVAADQPENHQTNTDRQPST